MTPEQINIAIAEECGWVIKDNGTIFTPSGDYYGQVGFTAEAYHQILPNCHNDLNAMHEAEKQFYPPVSKKWNRYIDRLMEVVCDEIQTVACASAPQRAEAFLRTVGKWIKQDSKT